MQPAKAHPSLKKGSDTRASLQVVVGYLPKLLPVVTACVEGTATEAQGTGGSRPVPPPTSPSVTSCALGVLDLLAFSLRSTLRPHLRRIQAVSAPWLQVRGVPHGEREKLSGGCDVIILVELLA